MFQKHYSRKRFGQNFLKNKHIIEKIISFIHPQKGEVLVEIGPGLGALTIPMSTYLDTMTVVELDRNLALRLQDNPFLESKLTVYQQDVMTFDFFKLAQEKGQPLRIFGNLPYNISTPLMFYLFRYINLIKDMHFMLQKEVVNRLVALPGSKNYSRLSVIAQYYCKNIQMLEVPSSSFRPKPKVDSALVRQIPFTKSPYPIIDIHLLRHITTVAFAQRRKKLRNSLKHIFTENILDTLNISSSLRAENLTVEQYCMLANWLGNHLGLD